MSFLKIVVPFLAATGLALPHDQMVNNESIRDIGVIYSGNNFTGDATFLVTHKKERKCETALSGVSVSSVQICVPATCILYKSNDCTASGDGNDYYFQGPVDANNLQANPNMACDSYECGSVEEMSALIGNTASALVNSEGGHWGVVSH